MEFCEDNPPVHQHPQDSESEDGEETESQSSAEMDSEDQVPAAEELGVSGWQWLERCSFFWSYGMKQVF